ncbi:MAG: hypothetical protein EXX96DRAFT_557266 [Benjaminiella poitrasii]|nr:MAG: hypothetical protein EXX96DRAFT_557266 [Benjaminiella poitrasii]
MGQQSSKAQVPLTFGYISQPSSTDNDTFGDEEEDTVSLEREVTVQHSLTAGDFILDHPHLYRLLESNLNYTSQSLPPSPPLLSKDASVVCCAQSLARDLSYIDETYYPDIAHFYEDDDTDNNQESTAEDDDQNSLKENEKGLTKITIYPSAIPKRLVNSPSLVIDLSGRSLIKLSSSIGYLENLTKLDLSNNQITSLPRAIGQLTNLRILNASKNQLESVPETIITMSKLKALNLSHNRLSTLPTGMGTLPSLIILILSYNEFWELPREIAQLSELVTLNVSYNRHLKSIPTEIAMLKSLRKLMADHCGWFVAKSEEEEEQQPQQQQEDEEDRLVTMEQDQRHDPPSLLEFCARTMISTRSHRLAAYQRQYPMLVDYLLREERCSFCGSTYFDAYVTRYRVIERMGKLIMLDYRLCRAHWSDEGDRLYALFSASCLQRNEQGSSQTNEDEQEGSSSSHLESLATPPYQRHQSHEPRSSEEEESVQVESVARPRSRSTASSYAPSPSPLALHNTVISRTLDIMTPHHEQRHPSMLLPFASFTNQQAEEVNRILLRRSQEQDNSSLNNRTMMMIRKSNNNIKQGFAQLGAKLGRRRDRSETF